MIGLRASPFIAFVKQTVLDSYHNGQKAGPRPTPQGGAAQSGRREWRNKKPCAGNAQFSRTNYQS
jgi:hypothetical protein